VKKRFPITSYHPYYQDSCARVYGVDSASTDAGFVVVWSSGSSYWEVGGSNDGDGVGLFLRDFTTAGGAPGIEKQANSGGAGNQRRPALARDALMLLKKALGEAVTLACAPCAVASAQTLRALAGP
jgi:hypothetical protein